MIYIDCSSSFFRYFFKHFRVEFLFSSRKKNLYQELSVFKEEIRIFGRSIVKITEQRKNPSLWKPFLFLCALATAAHFIHFCLFIYLFARFLMWCVVMCGVFYDFNNKRQYLWHIVDICNSADCMPLLSSSSLMPFFIVTTIQTHIILPKYGFVYIGFHLSKGHFLWFVVRVTFRMNLLLSLLHYGVRFLIFFFWEFVCVHFWAIVDYDIYIEFILPMRTFCAMSE